MKKGLLIGLSITIVAIAFIILGIMIVKKQDAFKKDINNYPNIEGSENVKEDNGSRVNVSDVIKKNHNYSNYTLTSSKLKTKDGLTTFTTTIKNKTNKKQLGHSIEIIFLDKEKKEVSKMNAYISDLGASEEAQLTVFLNKDLANAYDYQIVKK